MTALDTVERFFTAYYSGDAAATRDTITDDFSLIGPFAAAHSADEFFAVAEGLLTIVRGHRVLRTVVNGDDVAALYEIGIAGPAGIGWLPTGGWFTVTGDRVSSGQLIYDHATFDAIVSPA
ncbi:nuclear transport factor 2 family protein [Umezawaea sp. NPDC059074]|uniref:nuclear transport factor 2 family protein n=1 Tax=Umezawaea sp. NPDC059074 TaxID=3346716 RepID=UPI0036A16A9A